MESHHIHPELLRLKVRVLVVGCGGNGSAIAQDCRICIRHSWHTDIQKASGALCSIQSQFADKLRTAALQPI
jgi:hypothetical protein